MIKYYNLLGSTIINLSITIIMLIIVYNIIHINTNGNALVDTSINTNIKNVYDNFDKSALVTGGARGIGLAYVKALLDRGYKVAILDILNAEKKANELQNIYGKNNIIGIYCDVTNREMYKKSFLKASRLSKDGILDIVILNAGINGQLFHNSVKVIETNLLAPIYGTELYIRQLTNDLKEKSTKKGLIIITCSLASFVPIHLNLSPAYDASKAGIGEFVRSCTPISSRYNFRINAICPAGNVNTDMTKLLVNTYAKRKMNDYFLSTEGRGQTMEPEDMIPALDFIINNENMNGELVAVNKHLGFDHRIEPQDECGAFKEYGEWNEKDSWITQNAINFRLGEMKQSGQLWSDS